ncbi:hypothetical protein FQN57_001229 [Myotisia sp. PD_48]|nr:hypothetical protein FQN57_001229 [Myotisia sp. PD_48]
MEIFCRNIPEQPQEKHLKRELKPILQQFGIYTFECRRIARRNAAITIAELDKAQRVLNTYGQPDRRKPPSKVLKLFGVPIYLSKSNNEPTEMLLRSLEYEELKRTRHPSTRSGSVAGDIQRVRRFDIVMMSCGVWDYKVNRPVFVEYFCLQHTGSLFLGKTKVKVDLRDLYSTAYFMEIPRWTIRDEIYLGTSNDPSVTITTDFAPRFSVSDATEKLKVQLSHLTQKTRPPPDTRRVGWLTPDHENVSARCFTYRFVLKQKNDLNQVNNLSHDRSMPRIYQWNDHCVSPRTFYNIIEREFQSLISRSNLPYSIKFQLQSLVWNGELTPGRAGILYVHIRQIHGTESIGAIVHALGRLKRNIQRPSPNVQANDVGIETMKALITEAIENFKEDREDSEFRLSQSTHVMVHRATVTPAGIYLYGPCSETKNRILRKYAGYVDYFLRVEFTDETGDPVYFDPRVSLDHIFKQRFAGVLKRGIDIGGRHFDFLGFSHSSLRSQRCWFVAPFTTFEGEYMTATNIIGGLGEFGHILSPAKQAARIGQAFSETPTSIAVPRECVMMGIPDVKRNRRVFSDGVGVLSYELLYKIWNEYALRDRVKPTLFQVRVGGAKGMVSLDSKLEGETLKLRESMVKFPTKDSYNIEICGAGNRALPFYLNNQIIKLLEDLGVPFEAFRKLQEAEKRSIYTAITSTSQAARFLEETNVAKSARLPWLLRILKGLGVRSHNDPFLHHVLGLTALLKLRDLKYRARIRVPNAVTLYGIMDETGYLKEGQIFCAFLTEQGHREVLVRNSIVITRSPALHPGDVQIVNAVDVPFDSPLRKLHNCVVFSQHGERDLPSMLSGGDLDGDLYNIIYDDSLRPRKTFPPADYPLVQAKELDAPVTPSDIIDFFITFMQQDQLGRIATTHLALADQLPAGTLDEKCLLLAQLHSEAVDYSKSGKPVDVMRIPPGIRYRPDFMAPSPRIPIAESLDALADPAQTVLEEDDDEDDDRPRTRFYRSNKILGHLYRGIDEQDFLRNLHKIARTDPYSGTSTLQKVWNYIHEETKGFQWDHYVDDSIKIKEVYDDALRELMSQYSPTPWKNSITEYEVFVGTILGQGNKQSRRDKEASKSMREEYDLLVQDTVNMIRDIQNGATEALERSVACFWVAIQDERIFSQTAVIRTMHQDKLRSFPWVAAMACLNEVDLFQRSVPF